MLAQKLTVHEHYSINPRAVFLNIIIIIDVKFLIAKSLCRGIFLHYLAALYLPLIIMLTCTYLTLHYVHDALSCLNINKLWRFPRAIPRHRYQPTEPWCKPQHLIECQISQLVCKYLFMSTSQSTLLFHEGSIKTLAMHLSAFRDFHVYLLRLLFNHHL